jgi:hypothetical protein
MHVLRTKMDCAQAMDWQPVTLLLPSHPANRICLGRAQSASTRAVLEPGRQKYLAAGCRAQSAQPGRACGQCAPREDRDLLVTGGRAQSARCGKHVGQCARLEDKILGDHRVVDRALGGQALQPAQDGQQPGQHREEDLQHQTWQQPRARLLSDPASSCDGREHAQHRDVSINLIQCCASGGPTQGQDTQSGNCQSRNATISSANTTLQISDNR